jgi:hypothetical protein
MATKTTKAVTVEPEVKSPEAIEKETEKRIAAEEKVTFIIPTDPRFPADQQFWEHCVNGVIYRYPRGEQIELPKSLAETFLRKLKMQQASAMVIGEFKGIGKKIN